MVLRRMGVELVITRVANRSIRRLLVAHGIISASSGAGEVLNHLCIICMKGFRVQGVGLPSPLLIALF
jgi:hypothetical protein